MRKHLATVMLVGMLIVPWGNAEAQQSMRPCVNLGPVVNAQTMASSRSFEIERDNSSGQPGLLTLYVALTDADTSITRLDMICTASHDNNTTDYTIQSCAVASGACTSSNASWRKPSPGSANWPWRVDIEGYEDVECTFSVGAGTGAAADLLTVRGRLCGK